MEIFGVVVLAAATLDIKLEDAVSIRSGEGMKLRWVKPVE